MSDTILVVDDEIDMATTLRAILQKFGYNVLTADSSQEALDFIHKSLQPGEQEIDLALLDIKLSGESGIELCRTIRADKSFANLPIMMLTGLASIDSRLSAFEAGADDYLIKPIDHRELLARMQIQLRLRRAERDVLRRSRELAALRTVSESLSHSTEDFHTMLEHALTVTCDVLQTDAGLIYLIEDNGKDVGLATARGLSEQILVQPAIHYAQIDDTLIGQVIQAGKALAVEDLANSPSQNKDFLHRENLKSAAYIPIRAEGTVMGMLITATHQPRTFHIQEIDLLETIGAQLGVAIVRSQLHHEARIARDQARELARQVVQSQEDERRRIAQELHDQLGQTITALKLDLQLLRDELPAETDFLKPRLTDDISMASDMLEGIRTLSLSLRPAILDDLGLVPALRWYADLFSLRTGLKVALASEKLNDGRLPGEVEIVAFRCMQEILTNAARHAQAGQITITMATIDDNFHMHVTDNGIGFSTEKVLGRNASYQSLGLSGMQERAALVGGNVKIDSQPGKGTQTTITIPLQTPSGNREL